MFTVTKQKVSDGLLVELQGSLEEHMNLDEQIGVFDGALTVNCRGITRINSVGVKIWMRYFQTIAQRGHKIKYVECPPAIVEQLNLISNFSCEGEVVSILLPYSCTVCNNDFVAKVGVAELKENNCIVPSAKCEKPDCGAQFDDDPNEYLYFMQD
ncbi:MAG: hypothetical protein JST80_02600 [Bdellovibrionales bacterium]|nr:hypothetical protein [Bdellovibrionales bacterium]